jgi:hypothetical protein
VATARTVALNPTADTMVKQASASSTFGTAADWSRSSSHPRPRTAWTSPPARTAPRRTARGSS